MSSKNLPSVKWTCEYRYCNTIFIRYQSQINEGIKKFCSQSCAALENVERKREQGLPLGQKPPTRNCLYCNIECSTWSQTCKECQKIKSNCKPYRLLVEDYFRLLREQNNQCAICRLECSTGRRLAIDHDHGSGKIRGLLCYSCNIKLGWLEKKKKEIEDYLASEALR